MCRISLVHHRGPLTGRRAQPAVGRWGVATLASDRETVNYSSKRRCHSVPRAVGVSQPGSREAELACAGEFSGPAREKACFQLSFPRGVSQSVGRSVGHQLWVSAWRNASAFHSGSGKYGAQPGNRKKKTRSSDRTVRNLVPYFAVVSVVYAPSNYLLT